MAVMNWQGQKPRLAPAAFVAPSADVVGQVTIEEGGSIWHGAVLRADLNRIHIGKFSNVQDLCVIHVDHDRPVEIGAYVTVGHGAILHGCQIGDFCLIGMNATVLDGAKIGVGCIIGAGCLIPPGKEIPPYSQVIGMPGKITKELSEEKAMELKQHALSYWQLAQEYRDEAQNPLAK